MSTSIKNNSMRSAGAILYLINKARRKNIQILFELFKNIIAESEISDNMVEQTYEIGIRVATNYVGGPAIANSSTKDDLLIYCENIGKDIPEYIRNKIKKVALKKSEKLSIDLLVTIKEAKSIKSEDANDKSDPYCKIWINPTEQFKTKILKDTLNPVWNENFLFKNISEDDKLIIEVWDADKGSLIETAKEITDIRGVKSLFTYVKDIVETGIPFLEKDDLIGLIQIPIKEIPFVNEDGDVHDNNIIINLRSHRKIFSATLSASFRFIVNFKEKNISSMIDHACICKVLLHHHLQQSEINKIDERKLHQLFEPEGWTLLKQHALQSNLFPLKHYYCLWFCMSHKLKEENIKYQYSTFKWILKKIKQFKDILEEESEDPSFKNLFMEDLQSTQDYCIKQLDNMHTVFPLIEEKDKTEFQTFLSFLDHFKMFLPNNDNEVAKALQSDAEKWYEKQIENLPFPSFKKMSTKCEPLKEIISSILENQETLDEQFSNVFPDNTYSGYIYLILDNFMDERISLYIKKYTKIRYNDIEIQQFYFLYRTLKELIDYTLRKIDNIKNKPKLKMESYHEWFGDKCLFNWFKWITKLSLNWIDRSLDKDEMEPLSEEVLAGSSWIDLHQILINTVLGMWKKLEWPHNMADNLLIESLNDCIIFYISKMTSKLEKENYYNVDKEYEISQKLCVAINNMIKTENTIDELTEFISNNIINRDTSINNGHLLLRFQATVEFIKIAIYSIRKKIIAKIKNETARYISKIIGATTQNKRKAYNEMYSYSNYCLYTMNRYMYRKAFEAIMEDMWYAVLSILDGYANDLLEVDKFCQICKSKRIRRCSDLLTILTEYQDILNGDGSGLEFTVMKNEKYKDLKKKLVLLEMMEVEKKEQEK